MTDEHAPTRFWIERLDKITRVLDAPGEYVEAWVPVGTVELEGDHPYPRDALVAWAGEQDDEPPLGHYRVIRRHQTYATLHDFEIREHRERVIERVEDIPLAEDIATLSRAALTPADDAMAGDRAAP